MANLAKLPSLPQPATSLQRPSPAQDPSPCMVSPPARRGLRSRHRRVPPVYAVRSQGRRRPAPDYMALHTKRDEPVTPALRAVLVEWLASLAPTLHFQSRTLHLAVLCLDRFLAAARARPFVRSVRKLITITAAALLVAYKYEKLYLPNVEGIISETSRALGGCTRDVLLAAEVAVLKALRYDLGAPTAFTFLEHFLERLGVNGDGRGDAYEAVAQLATYVAELSLLDYGILRFRPSVVAASAILVARVSSEDKPWGHEHERATGYMAAELKDCAERLNRLHENNAKDASSSVFEHMRKKYNSSNFDCAWTWPPLACI